MITIFLILALTVVGGAVGYFVYTARESRVPNAYFIDGMLFWGGSLSKETVLAKGFYLDLPDLRGASFEAKNAFQEQLWNLLSLVDDGWALQIQWMVDSDYTRELAKYREVTETRATNKWTRFVRDERYNYFKTLMDNGELRRERLALFFARKVSTMPKGGYSLAQTSAFLGQQARIIEQRIARAATVLNIGRVQPMGDVEHYLFAKRFFNPSLLNVCDAREDRDGAFDPRASLVENCVFSDGIKTTDGEGNVVFRMDDHYHAIIVLTRWPRQTFPGVIEALTSAVTRDYAITQNIYPVNIQREIDKEEKSLRRVEGDASREGTQSSASAARKKRTKIDGLMTGFTIPFKVLTVIRVWDRSLDGLAVKTLAVKSALQAMNGAQFHQTTMASQARKLFFETFPGWLGGRYRAWDMYAESGYLADVLPMSSTYVGDLEQGEALYHGTQRNLVGVATFSPTGTPQNACFLGMSRSGKSVTIQDVLSQTEPFYDFTAIIEEGLSYGTWTRLQGETPIIIQSDSSLTINYFDTGGTPLNALTIGTATALCAKMAGMSRDEDRNKRMAALFARYINQLYTDAFDDWRSANEAEYERVCREAYVLEQFRRTRMAPGTGTVEAFAELKALKGSDPDAYWRLFEGVQDEDVIAFSKGVQTSADVRNLAFAYFQPEEFPTHQTLVETMRFAKLDGDDEAEVDYLATMLANWCRVGGSYGQLFDGPTNFKVTGTVAHFELGYIPDANKELKEAAGFLISNFVRTHIVSMPRSKRKRIVFEEASRFMAMSTGEQIMSECYAQLSKFNTWVLTATQQYAQMKKSSIRAVVFGNSKLFFLTKQQDRGDLEDIAGAVGLPERAVEAVRDFVLPEHQRHIERRYSDVLMFSLESNIAGVARNIPSDQMLWVASSSGSDFDKRVRALAKYPDPFEAVMGETGLGGLITPAEVAQ